MTTRLSRAPTRHQVALSGRWRVHQTGSSPADLLAALAHAVVLLSAVKVPFYDSTRGAEHSSPPNMATEVVKSDSKSSSTPKAPPQKAAQGPNESLLKPFKCPGSAAVSRTSAKPARKRRKVDYSGADADGADHDKPWTSDERQALMERHINRYPVFEVRDKAAAFKSRFAVPLINKDSAGYSSSRAMPALGMRLGASFVVKPLHDPSGEFAIVLYDPTVDDKPTEEESSEEKPQGEKPTLDVPLMHKSLADILGLKKKVEQRPRVPVVIDPRLAKVLRPHQVEGVKVRLSRPSVGDPMYRRLPLSSSSIVVPPACSRKAPTAVSWPMRWVWGRRCVLPLLPQ